MCKKREICVEQVILREQNLEGDDEYAKWGLGDCPVLKEGYRVRWPGGK